MLNPKPWVRTNLSVLERVSSDKLRTCLEESGIIEPKHFTFKRSMFRSFLCLAANSTRLSIFAIYLHRRTMSKKDKNSRASRHSVRKAWRRPEDRRCVLPRLSYKNMHSTDGLDLILECWILFWINTGTTLWWRQARRYLSVNLPVLHFPCWRTKLFNCSTCGREYHLQLSIRDLQTLLKTFEGMPRINPVIVGGLQPSNF